MSFYNFRYSAKIGNNSAFSQTDRMKYLFPFFAQMEIKSNTFDSSKKCEEELAKLLVTLVQKEHKITEKNYVLIKKLNPAYDSESKEEAWDKRIIYRFFTADSEKLKESVLDYPFFGEIVADGPDTVH